MSSDKPDRDNAKCILDFYDQAIFVAGDVKTLSIVGQDTGSTIVRFYLGRSSPLSQFCRLVPSLERLFGVGMLFPELSECALRNNSQRESILCSRFGIKIPRYPGPEADACRAHQLSPAIVARDFPKMFRASLCGHVPKLFTVSGHEHHDLAGGLSEVKPPAASSGALKRNGLGRRKLCGFFGQRRDRRRMALRTPKEAYSGGNDPKKGL